jgi:hypothetical protein
VDDRRDPRKLMGGKRAQHGEHIVPVQSGPAQHFSGQIHPVDAQQPARIRLDRASDQGKMLTAICDGMRLAVAR